MSAGADSSGSKVPGRRVFRFECELTAQKVE